MKRKSKRLSRSKSNSPTKRKWFSRVSEILKKANKERLQSIQLEATEEKTRAEIIKENLQDILSQSKDMASLEKIEQLLDEAEYLNIPQEAQEYVLLKEVSGEAKTLQKEVAQIFEGEDLGDGSGLEAVLVKGVKGGVGFKAFDQLKNIVVLNCKMRDGLRKKLTLHEIETLIAQGEKKGELVDQGTLQNLNQLRLKYKELNSSAEEILNVPQFSLVDEKELRETINKIENCNFRCQQLQDLMSVVEIIDRIKAMKGVLCGGRGDCETGGEGGMAIEQENGVEVQAGEGGMVEETKEEASLEDFNDILFKLSNQLRELEAQEELDGEIKGALGSNVKKVRKNLEGLTMDHSELSLILSKSESLLWKDEAKILLKNNNDDQETLTSLLDKAPKELVAEGCKQYSQIKERVHAIQAAIMNENRIKDTIQGYWNDTKLHIKGEEVENFISDSKNYILKKEVERQLDLLSKAQSLLKNPTDLNDLNKIVDEMRKLSLGNTKVYEKFSGLAKTIEKSNKQKAWLNLNRKKLEVFRKGNKMKISSIIKMPRMKLSVANQIKQDLESLPNPLRPLFEEDLKLLISEIETAENLNSKIEELIVKYPMKKFWEVSFEKNEILEANKELKEALNVYFSVSYRCKETEKILEELDLMIRAFCLLKNIGEVEVRRDIPSWESVMKLLKEKKKETKKRNNILNSITKKLKMADKILMEVYKMRQYQQQFSQAGTSHFTTSAIARQSRMPTIDQAKKLLRDYNRNCKEIELKDTTSQLEKYIKECKERVSLASKDGISLSELSNLQEQLRRTPLNVEHITYEVSEKIIKAQDFFKSTKSLLSKSLGKEIDRLKEEYSKLKIRIPEFEKLEKQVITERKKIEGILKNFDKLKLTEVIMLRQEIQQHAYHKNKELEEKMLYREVELLEQEFEMAQVTDDDNKPLFNLISLKALLTEIKESSKTRINKVGDDNNLEKRCKKSVQFLNRLINDVKSYLNNNIFTLDLEGLKKLESHNYKNFVDINNEITDHKIKLEIKMNEVKESNNDSGRMVEEKKKSETRKYDAFGLFGTEFALVSKIEDISPEKEVKEEPKVEPKFEEGAMKLDEEADLAQRRGYKYDSKRLMKRKKSDMPYFQAKKPVVTGTEVRKKLRTFFTNHIKFWLEKNDSFEISGLDALMAANNLEKQIYEKYMDRLEDYDNLCESICKAFRQLLPLKYLSKHIRNKGFQISTLIRLTTKDRMEFRRIDMLAKSKMENLKKGVTRGVLDEANADEPKPKKKMDLLAKINNVKEEGDLQFSDIEEGMEDVEMKIEEDKATEEAMNFNKARVLSYDPETRQYKATKNRFLESKKSSGYMYHKLFEGNVNLETKERDSSKKIEDIKLISSTGEDFIKYFTEIPEGLNLTSQLSLFEFEQYIQKVLLSEQALNYLVLPFWLECATPLATKNYFKAQGCVASMQYSKRCKIFIFPKEFLKHEWLSTLNFYVMKDSRTQIELVGFVVLKLIESSGYEISVIPQSLRVDPKVHKAFKLFKNGNDTMEREIDLMMLQEKKLQFNQSPAKRAPKKSERFFEDLVNNQNQNRNKKKTHMTKLQRLMKNPKNFTAYSPGFNSSTSEAFRNSDSQSPSNYQSNLLNALKIPGGSKGSQYSSPNNRNVKIEKQGQFTPQSNSGLLGVLGVRETTDSTPKDSNLEEKLSRVSTPNTKDLDYQIHHHQKPRYSPHKRQPQQLLGKRPQFDQSSNPVFNDKTNMLGKPLKKFQGPSGVVYHKNPNQEHSPSQQSNIIQNRSQFGSRQPLRQPNSQRGDYQPNRNRFQGQPQQRGNVPQGNRNYQQRHSQGYGQHQQQPKQNKSFMDGLNIKAIINNTVNTFQMNK